MLDIVVAAAKIEETRAFHASAEEMKFHYQHWDSVIREFEIVGEATKHLLQMGWLDAQEKRVVDFRNLIVHYYFGIDAEAVDEVIKTHLPPFVERVKARFLACPKPIRQEALQWAMQEYAHIKSVKKALENLKGETP